MSLSRRQFLKRLGVTGAAITIGRKMEWPQHVTDVNESGPATPNATVPIAMNTSLTYETSTVTWTGTADALTLQQWML